MAAIRPFRHLIVYPSMMRQIKRESRVHEARSAPADAGTDRASARSGLDRGGPPSVREADRLLLQPGGFGPYLGGV